MESLIPYLDAPTAARLRTTSKEWKRLVDAYWTLERYEKHISENWTMTRLRINFSHETYEFVWDDITQICRRDMIRRIVSKNEALRPYFQNGYILFRGIVPRPFIEDTYRVDESSSIHSDHYFILFSNDPIYANVQERWEMYELTSFPN